MFWAFLIFIFSVLLQAGAGYAVGDIIAHALSYDLTRKTAIWEGIMIIVLLLLKSWMEYHFAPEKKSKAAISVPESVIWFAGTIVLAGTLELYTNLEIPVKIAAMLLFVLCSLIFEKDSYLQYFRLAEDEVEKTPEEHKEDDEEYTFAVDRMRKETAQDAEVKGHEETEEKICEDAEESADNVKHSTRIIAEDEEILLEVVEEIAEDETVAAGDAARLETPENDTESPKGEVDRAQQSIAFPKTEAGPGKQTEETKPANTGFGKRVPESGVPDPDGTGVEKKETGSREKGSSRMTGFYVGARVIARLASILIGILALMTLHDTKNRIRDYIIMLIGAIVTVVFRLLPGEPGVRDKESRSMENDTDEENARLQRKRIIYVVVSLLVTVFLCTRSMLVGMIFLLDAFLVGVIVPMATYRYAIGGTDVVEKKTDILSRITSRVLLTVILIIAAWLLSYGALWEYEFLMILGTAFAAQELLLGQNARVFICKE